MRHRRSAHETTNPTKTIDTNFDSHRDKIVLVKDNVVLTVSRQISKQRKIGDNDFSTWHSTQAHIPRENNTLAILLQGLLLTSSGSHFFLAPLRELYNKSHVGMEGWWRWRCGLCLSVCVLPKVYQACSLPKIYNRWEDSKAQRGHNNSSGNRVTRTHPHRGLTDDAVGTAKC